MANRIANVVGRKVFDSRGVQTVEIDVVTEKGNVGRVAAPFGAPGSRGPFEAPAYAPGGLDESLAILEQDIAPNLVGMDVEDQEAIDAFLHRVDSTSCFSRIGGNLASAISLAAARAASLDRGLPLFAYLQPDAHVVPIPLGNIIGGGAHSMGPAPDMQEHLVAPVGAKSIAEAVYANICLHEQVGEILEKAYRSFTGGTDDECAWTADMTDMEAFDVISAAARRVEESLGVQFRMGLDLAADRLWDSERTVYVYAREGRVRTTEQQIEYVCELVQRYHLIYVEDIFHSNDYESFARVRSKVADTCLVCADDLYASNVERTREGIKKGSADAMIIKPNQVGTLTGARETALFAKGAGYHTVISHRSGETMDDSIAHLGVAWGCTFIKTGVLGGERLAKLNELIRIWDMLGDRAEIARVF